ncbi:DNA-binding protein [Saccharibacillus sp. CPCC 101409]|uniref:DNA-binding protein n=1 Tax=Saccharibacillus sp. CPCC 101409 TaxID=3058041 RepID=UPI0026737693|nr:DNA-binding protein [Saccharibacillus sp. CPCC 101409]MDO3409863.1 DNA-binding protein [Saccharibacillus sp. CPCC 101409]
MLMQKTLRSEIEKSILESSLNFAEFSRLSGLNRGIFSAVLNANPPKPISLNQLETIGKALGQAPDWMFDYYVEECFYHGKPNRRRVEPFLIRCADLKRIDLIEQVFSRLLEDLKYLDMIFEIGETLYLSDRKFEAIPFYECVVHNERYHQSERMAVSHYRLFCASISEEHEVNLRAIIRFEPYCENLPIHLRLAALMNLVDLYIALDKWNEVERNAQNLITLSNTLYRMNRKNKELSLLEKPLVVYYGYGFLAMENVMISYGEYEKAKIYLAGYEDLSWFQGMDDKAKAQVVRFSIFAEQNRNYLDLRLGDQMAVEKCMNFLELYPEDGLTALLTLLEIANTNDYNINEAIELLLKKIEQEPDPNYYQSKLIKSRYQLDIYYQKSIYYRRNKQYKKALKAILKATELADEINSIDSRKVHGLLLSLLEQET